MSAGRAGGWRGGNCGAWRVADLRDECAFKGLDTSGGKSALIARLDQHAARRTDGLDDSPFRHLSDDEHREICGVLLGFHAADAFCGRRPGCVFKTGGWGLGYYVDAAPCARDLLMFGSTCRDLRAIMMPPLQPYVANQLKQFRDFGDARQRTIRGEAHRCSVDSSLGSDPFRGIQWAGMPRKVEKKELAVLQAPRLSRRGEALVDGAASRLTCSTGRPAPRSAVRGVREAPALPLPPPPAARRPIGTSRVADDGSGTGRSSGRSSACTRSCGSSSRARRSRASGGRRTGTTRPRSGARPSTSAALLRQGGFCSPGCHRLKQPLHDKRSAPLWLLYNGIPFTNLTNPTVNPQGLHLKPSPLTQTAGAAHTAQRHSAYRMYFLLNNKAVKRARHRPGHVYRLVELGHAHRRSRFPAIPPGPGAAAGSGGGRRDGSARQSDDARPAQKHKGSRVSESRASIPRGRESEVGIFLTSCSCRRRKC